jgi:hypothetical protein
MGYRKIPTIYTLANLPEEDGLIVRMRAIRIGKVRSLMKAMSSQSESDESLDEMFALLLEGLVSWNLEDENGVPVPATAESLDEMELPFVMTILEAWLTQMTGPDEGLGKGSGSGATFPGRPLTMEAL